VPHRGNRSFVIQDSFIFDLNAPVSHTENWSSAGFLIERTIEVFQRAKVVAEYEEVPAKRITTEIQENLSPICSPSWYKLPERELYARFSRPIHQDKPHLILASAHAADAIRATKSLKELFSNRKLTLGKVSGVSYGAELDTMISTVAQEVMDSSTTPLGLAKMIQHRRADYMLMDEEDYTMLSLPSEAGAEDVKAIRFPDMPAGLTRYIMCSKSVSPATMDRLNKAITQVVPALK